METKTTDIRAELERFMVEIQNQIVSLRDKRDKIDEQLKDADSALAALRKVYELQSKRMGEYKAPTFPIKGSPSRFTGMKLIDALALIRKENPGIKKRDACKILEKEAFNFRTDRHLSAVHFAWIALERKRKGGR
jgi:hypothetical protein